VGIDLKRMRLFIPLREIQDVRAKGRGGPLLERFGCVSGGEDAGFLGRIHAERLKNGHSEQAALISVVVEVSHDFARGELMHGVVGVAGEFVLDGAEDVLDAELGT